MNESQHLHLFNLIRRIVVFALGVLVFLDGLNDKSNTLAELIIGSIMIGVLPIDVVIRPEMKQLIDRAHKRALESKSEAPEEHCQ